MDFKELKGGEFHNELNYYQFLAVIFEQREGKRHG
jgi:hypothetical protein